MSTAANSARGRCPKRDFTVYCPYTVLLFVLHVLHGSTPPIAVFFVRHGDVSMESEDEVLLSARGSGGYFGDCGYFRSNEGGDRLHKADACAEGFLDLYYLPGAEMDEVLSNFPMQKKLVEAIAKERNTHFERARYIDDELLCRDVTQKFASRIDSERNTIAELLGKTSMISLGEDDDVVEGVRNSHFQTRGVAGSDGAERQKNPSCQVRFTSRRM